MDITNRKGKVTVSAEFLKKMQIDGKNHLSFMLVLFIEHHMDRVVYYGVSDRFDISTGELSIPIYDATFSNEGTVKIVKV